MAYLTGGATSYDDIMSVLVQACTAAGWSFSDGILSKGLAFVLPRIVTEDKSDNSKGIRLELGTGKQGAGLAGAATGMPRLGSPTSALGTDPVFPATYFLFVHTNPDEVYFLLRSGPDKYFHLAFGVSNTIGRPGSGLWASATAGRRKCWHGSVSLNINEAGGNSGSYYDKGYFSSPWWDTSDDPVHGAASLIHLGDWVRSGDLSRLKCNAVQPLIPLVAHSPNTWNAESVLLPIRVHWGVAENKNMVVHEHAHARYLRIGNHEPEQVITIGTERWKVFPFFQKDLTSQNYGANGKSGTFGWAIRYDGP